LKNGDGKQGERPISLTWNGGEAENMKNGDPLKADWNGRRLKGAFDCLPGPWARTFWAKIMRQLSFHGSGGPKELRIVDCGMRIEK
jgi:hypothetical protein